MESIIRDHIANNLAEISSDFTLISTEYYLKPVNPSFTKSYIDILAKDKNDKIVIIEVKKSNQTARQAIHELIKYKTAIQSKFCINSNEVRLLIISVEWDELLVPYSEFSNKYSVEGFKLQLDGNLEIVDIQSVSPIKINKLEKNVSNSQVCYVFKGEADRDNFTRRIRSKVLEIGINDFVIFQMLNEHNNTTGFEFLSYVAFIQQSDDDYFSIIKKSGLYLEEATEYLENKDEYFDTTEALEGIILALLPHSPDNSFLETSDPYKLKSLLSVQGWRITDVLRNGIFNEDPRNVKDEQILRKVLKEDSGSAGYFNEIVDSNELEIIDEITSKIDDSFSKYELFSTAVLQVVRSVFKRLAFERFHINIYHPADLLSSIGHSYYHKDARYFPKADISVLTDDLIIESFKIEYGWKSKNDMPQLDENIPEINGFDAMFGLYNDWLFEKINLVPVAFKFDSESEEWVPLKLSDSNYRESNEQAILCSEQIFLSTFISKVGEKLNSTILYE